MVKYTYTFYLTVGCLFFSQTCYHALYYHHKSILKNLRGNMFFYWGEPERHMREQEQRDAETKQGTLCCDKASDKKTVMLR